MGKKKDRVRPYRFDLLQGFIARHVFPWLFSRVEISPEHLKKWRRLVSKGMVIPILDSPSRIDFLALYHLYRSEGGNYPKFPMGISMVPWISVRGIYVYLKAFFLWLVKKTCLFDPFFPEEDQEITRLGRVPFTLYLHPAGAYIQRCLSFRTTPLESIVRFQRGHDQPVYLVPHLVLYGVLPPTEKKSLYTAFWGEMSMPRWTMRVKSLLFRKRIQVRIGTPIDVQRFLKQHPSEPDNVLAREIHHAAAAILDKKLRGILGPPLPSRDRMVTQILEDPETWELLDQLSRETEKPVEELARKARAYASEIAADLRPSYVKQWEKILRWVWQSLYDGVDINEGAQQRLRRIARNYPVVYIPSHKSHIDYFLLSFVLYEMNLPLPLIAAGVNLLFWPVGPIFRRSSAFFIRRTFRDNPLYGEIFYFYLRELIREGVPLEFFIEGGRSRTGKLILPKKGMLSMIFRAFFEGAAPDIYVVPTAVSYERIVEEEGYIRELRGDEKRKERTRDLFRIRKIFKKRYGKVYVRFGKPVSLKRYLEKLGVERLPESVEERQSLYQRSADDIIRAIQKTMAVTPSSLVAAALLSFGDRGMRRSEVMATAQLYLRLLRDLGVDFPEGEKGPEPAFLRSLDLFMQDGVLQKGVDIDSDDPHYFVPPEKRIHLEFSKNMMVSHLAPLSLYTWAVSTRPKETGRTVFQAFTFLFRLFKYEFLLFSDSPVRWVRLGHAILKPLSDREIAKLRHLTLSALEGYFVAATYTLRNDWEAPRAEKKLVREMIRLGKEMVEASQIRCPESVTSAILLGWLRIAREEKILSAVEGGIRQSRKRGERLVERGVNFREVGEIAEFLDRLLSLL